MAPSELDAVVEVEFRVDDPTYPLVAVPDELGCAVHAEQIVPRSEGAYSVFYSLTGAAPEEVMALVEDHEGLDVRPHSRREDGGVFEVVVSNPGDHLVVTLTDAGALPREIGSVEGRARILVEIPPMYRTAEVIDRVRTAHPSLMVVAKREKAHTVPLFTRRELRTALDDVLTPRQREVLELAYRNDYFRSPRGRTGEELAAELDISPPTFTQHLRKAQDNVCRLLFE